MKDKESIYVRVRGAGPAAKITPESFDIREVRGLLDMAEKLLYPVNTQQRPLISYDIEKGSVVNRFTTHPQEVIALTANLHEASKRGSIDFLHSDTAKSIEYLQNTAYEKNYEIEVSSSTESSLAFQITPQTKWKRSEAIWVDTEIYVYGTIKDAGGKSKVNIHLDTKEHGYLRLATSPEYLQGFEVNLLYRRYGARVTTKQNLTNGELDYADMRLIELIDYDPLFDHSYLDSLIKKATPAWRGIEVDRWIGELRRGEL